MSMFDCQRQEDDDYELNARYDSVREAHYFDNLQEVEWDRQQVAEDDARYWVHYADCAEAAGAVPYKLKEYDPW